MAPAMDAIPHKQARNSRWSRDPVVGATGAAIAVFPTDRDIEIFQLLVRFRYLPSDYIHAFVGGNLKALTRRLNSLSRKPNIYLTRPHQQRQSADANYRRLIYQLDERGSRVLRERGLSFLSKSSHHNFAHELMVAQITASLELGTRENTNIRLIRWSEILANANTPQATRESATPATVRVSYAMRGEPRSDDITADARPFGLERMIDGRRSYLFFPGIEADCATEPLDASDFDRSSITKKLAAYIAIGEQGIYRSHFGFPNFFVPFITTSTARMGSMMQLLHRITGGRGSKMFLFRTFPSGHMLTAPWQRVGFPPLTLDR
jgi:Replication-relaxation